MRNSSSSSSWSIQGIVAACTISIGTAISSLCFQHVSNAVPKYFYSIAVISPLSGFIVYSIILIVQHMIITPKTSNNNNISDNNQRPKQQSKFMSLKLLQTTMKYCICIGICFATHNMLSDYGKSGSDAGDADVSTVLALILAKFVIPISLLLESILERTKPSIYEMSGVIILMIGGMITSLVYGGQQQQQQVDDDTIEIHHHSSMYTFKIVCLILASIPLALGFYSVKLARSNLPNISGVELWTLLCIPEFCFSIILAYTSEQQNDTTTTTDNNISDSTNNLYSGILCVIAGTQPQQQDVADDVANNNCPEACTFFWYGIPFSFAFNLAIPVLIKLKGSTSVPLFRALALPIASLVAMTPNIDSVIYTPFSYNGIFGVMLCTMGLIVYYGKDVTRIVYGGEIHDESDDETSSLMSASSLPPSSSSPFTSQHTKYDSQV